MADEKHNSFLKSTQEKDERLEALKQLYPELFADGKLNIDVLKEVTGLYNPQEERTPGYYGLYWPGKREAKIEAKASPKGTLVPVPGDGVDEERTHNIYIEGDNLEVLRILRQSYKGRVKMIYIDPPYNTGNDFIYPDNYKMAVDDYLSLTGQTDDKGKALTTNQKSNGAFHTKWLNMMLPRLMLSRELLTEDGVIFISIDDNEQANLKLLCDDVFGEENFVSQIVVKMSEASGLKMSHVEKNVPKLKEYVLFYRRGETTLNPIKVAKEKWDEEYKSYIKGISDKELKFIKEIIANEERTENDIKKCNDLLKSATYVSVSDCYKENSIESKEDKIKFNYKNAERIFQTVSMGVGATEAISEKRKKLNGSIFFLHETTEKKCYLIKGDYDLESRKPRMQVLFADDYLTYNPCDFWQDIKTTGLDNEGYFSFKNGKKPLKLLERLLFLCTTDGDIVLDFFSGSGSFGQAVMESNIENLMNRKYILVQLPENLDEMLQKASAQEKKPIKTAIDKLDLYGRKHFITELAKQRLRLASEEYNTTIQTEGGGMQLPHDGSIKGSLFDHGGVAGVPSQHSCSETRSKPVSQVLPPQAGSLPTPAEGVGGNGGAIAAEGETSPSSNNCELTADHSKLDTGFRVYRLAPTNFTTFTPTTGQDEKAQSELFAELEKNETPLVENWNASNVLTEIILKQGFALDCECVKADSFAKNTVYRIKDSEGAARRSTVMYVCLDAKIEEETISALTLEEKEKFVCLDAAIDDTSYARLCDKGRIETI